MSPRRVLSSAALACLGACAKKPAPELAASQVTAALPGEAPTAMPAPRHADPGVLGELLATVPSAHPADGEARARTRLGTDTGVAAASASPPSPNAAPRMETRPRATLSSPALERAAREQLYWPLVRVCRLADGSLPPADSVTLEFDLLADGSVPPNTVTTRASEERFRGVAECVERVFASSGFRGPVEGRGTHASVRITWPSVD